MCFWHQEHSNEVSREVVRKIGIARICCDLGLNAWLPQPYLKMVNPSLGTYHIEGVHPDCRTVAEALMWRNGSAETPRQLTLAGFRVELHEAVFAWRTPRRSPAMEDLPRPR